MDDNRLKYVFMIHPGAVAAALAAVAVVDINECAAKDASYGSSWKKRGGQGAYMMLARKWDRIEEQSKRHGYDLFAAMEAGVDLGDGDKLRSDVGDLRRYLMLVESEMRARDEERRRVLGAGHVPSPELPNLPPGAVRAEEPRPVPSLAEALRAMAASHGVDPRVQLHRTGPQFRSARIDGRLSDEFMALMTGPSVDRAFRFEFGAETLDPDQGIGSFNLLVLDDGATGDRLTLKGSFFIAEAELKHIVHPELEPVMEETTFGTESIPETILDRLDADATRLNRITFNGPDGTYTVLEGDFKLTQGLKPGVSWVGVDWGRQPATTQTFAEKGAADRGTPSGRVPQPPNMQHLRPDHTNPASGVGGSAPRRPGRPTPAQAAARARFFDPRGQAHPFGYSGEE